jgi:hypothetical protein
MAAPNLKIFKFFFGILAIASQFPGSLLISKRLRLRAAFLAQFQTNCGQFFHQIQDGISWFPIG